MPEVFVGIDVSKNAVDVAAWPGSEAWQVPNTEQGLAAVTERLVAMAPVVVVVEALASAGLALVVLNPRQVRDFAKATGKLAKTDALDARVLARFAAAVRPTPRPLPDATARRADDRQIAGAQAGHPSSLTPVSWGGHGQACTFHEG